MSNTAGKCLQKEEFMEAILSAALFLASTMHLRRLQHQSACHAWSHAKAQFRLRSFWDKGESTACKKDDGVQKRRRDCDDHPPAESCSSPSPTTQDVESFSQLNPTQGHKKPRLRHIRDEFVLTCGLVASMHIRSCESEPGERRAAEGPATSVHESDAS